MAITALPTPPSRDQSSDTFTTNADAFLGALPAFATEANALAVDVQDNADIATSSAGAAVAAIDAPAWVSGASYTAGDGAYSLVNFQTYRANTATSGTTDPSLSADWEQISGTGNSLQLTGGTMTGALKVEEFVETYASVSGTTPTIDCETGTVFSLTTSGNTTFTFSNPATAGGTGAAASFALEVTAGGTHTLSWPASVDWAGGTAPDAPASGELNVYSFYTRDAGTKWFGFLAGAAMA